MQRLVLLALVAVGVLRADLVSTTSCTLGTTTITSPTSCSLFYVNPDLMSAGTISAYVIADPQPIEPGFLEYPFPNLGVGAGVFTEDLPPEQNWATGASAEWTKTFTTPGPARDGLMSVFTLSSSDGGGYATASIGPYSCFASNLPTCNIESEYGQLLPLRLGTPFTVSLFGTISGSGDAGSNIEEFQLFEANGTTPVPLIVVPVPEPSTFGLLLLGVIAWCCVAARRRFKQSGSPQY